MVTLMMVIIMKYLSLAVLVSVLVVGIAIFLSKVLKLSKKGIFITFSILIIIIIGIINMLLNKPTITEKQRQKAIATVEYARIDGIDSSYYETYYIYKNINNKYYYYKTSSSITMDGPQEEKIEKIGRINSRKKLEKIIDSLEEKLDYKVNKPEYILSINNGLKLQESEYVTISYRGTKIDKQELLSKLFDYQQSEIIYNFLVYLLAIGSVITFFVIYSYKKNNNIIQEKIKNKNNIKLQKKNIIIKCILIVILLFIIWFVVFAINFIKCNKLETPILMKTTYVKEMILYKNSNGEQRSYTPIYYKGLGYSIESKATSKKEIIENKMYLFGKLINETSIDE